MSTAVLHGAGLENWCMNSEDEYLEFAISQSSNLEWLRANRSYWRNMVLSSELGNASSLMHSLENCFSCLATSSL